MFGKPWDRNWDDYITGYNSPIQNGRYVAPSFVDNYVFPNALARIGVGEIGEKTVLVTDNNVSLKQFANNAIAKRFINLVNLDGGGSRFLYYDKKTIYSSERIPYNILAFFKDEVPLIDDCPYPQPKRIIGMWCVGEDAKWVQFKLNQHGANLAVDGLFFGASVKALLAFQESVGLTADGLCGPLTVEELSK